MSDALQHEAYAALIPAYALAATDEDECRAIEAHLASCAVCRDLLTEYQQMASSLAYAVAPVAAPFGLGEELRRRVAQDRPAPRLHAVSQWPAFLRRPTLTFGLIAFVLLLLTNAYWASRVGRIEQETEVLGAIVSAPGLPLTAEASVPDSRGVLYLPPGSTSGLLCVYDLPALTDDQIYQAWLVRDGRRESAGLLRVNPEGYGVLLIQVAQPLDSYDSLGITIEPAGGSPAPTTPRVMGGAL